MPEKPSPISTHKPGSLTRTLAMDDTALWSDSYPWLGAAYKLVVVDGYNPDDRPAADVMAEKLAEISQEGEFWWIERDADAASSVAATEQWSAAATNFFAAPGVYTECAHVYGSAPVIWRVYFYCRQPPT